MLIWLICYDENECINIFLSFIYLAADPDRTDILSITVSADQARLGGRLFTDEAMSPNTLFQQKQVIEDAMAAINSRIDQLHSQTTSGSSKLDMS